MWSSCPFEGTDCLQNVQYVYKVRVPYDLQTGDHLHNTTAKGRDGGALWWYFTVHVLSGSML